MAQKIYDTLQDWEQGVRVRTDVHQMPGSVVLAEDAVSIYHLEEPNTSYVAEDELGNYNGYVSYPSKRTPNGYLGRALTLDYLGRWIGFPQDPIRTETGLIEFMFQPNSNLGPTWAPLNIGKWYFFSWEAPSGAKWQFYVDLQTGLSVVSDGTHDLTFSYDYNAGLWYNFKVTWDHAFIDVAVNDMSQATASNFIPPMDPGYNFFFGNPTAVFDNLGPARGKYDEIKIFQKHKTAPYAVTYYPDGTLTLRYDAGSSVKFDTLDAVFTTNPGQVVQVRYRAAFVENDLPSQPWSSYVTTFPFSIPPSLLGRFLEMEWGLSTTNTSETPVLESVTITHSPLIPYIYDFIALGNISPVPVGFRLVEYNSIPCQMQFEARTQGGAWVPAALRSIKLGSLFGNMATNVPSSVAGVPNQVIWDVTANFGAKRDLVVQLRARAFNGTFYSAWAVTDLIRVDGTRGQHSYGNVPSEGGTIVVPTTTPRFRT